MAFSKLPLVPLFPLVLGFLVLVTFIPLIYSAVVGIDLGSELLKIGNVAPGRPFEIVLNLHSKRKTPSAVSFVEETREFGEAALIHQTKGPPDVFLLTSALLALNSSSVPNPIESITGPFFPIESKINDERGIFEFYLKKRNITLAPEEVVANLLQFITRTVKDFQGFSPRQTKLDAILTIPSSFNMRQRQALIDASTIAGINLLGLVRETSAAALHHVRDLPSNFTGSKLFVNMGAWRTQVCVAEYNTTSTKPTQRKMSTNILYCDETDRVGGRHFSLELANFMLRKVETRFHTKDLGHRALQRIFQQAEKTKIVLSANKKSDFYIEGLYDGKDFHSSITREEFEKLIEPAMSVIRNLIETVLKESNIKKEELKGTEIVGGGWRVTKVQQLIESLVKPHDLGQHVNGDEGAAMGATLIAANASSTFRIKDTTFSDPSAFGYTLRYRNITSSEDTKTKKQEWKTKDVVKIGGRFGGFRTLSTRSCSGIEAELIETNRKGISTLLTKYEISEIKEACEGKYKEYGKAKVNFVFSAAATGIVTLERVVAQWEETYLAPAPKSSSTTTTTTTIANKKSDEKDATSSTSTEQTVTTTEEPKMIEQTRKHTIRCKVSTIETLPRPMTPLEINTAEKRLAEFDSIDTKAMKLAKARNNLESFVYSTRTGLETELIQSISTAAVRDKLREHLKQVEVWLYDDGILASIEELENQLRTLKDEFGPLEMKALAIKARNDLSQSVATMNDNINESLSAEILEKVELNATRIEEFLDHWREFTQWYSKLEGKQKKKALTDDPAYEVSEVKKKLDDMRKELEILLKSAKIKSPSVTERITERNNATSQTNTTETSTDKGTPTESSNNEIPTPAPRRKEFSKFSDEL